MKKIITLVTSIALTLGSTALVQAKNIYNVNRIQGANRYKTSLNISKNFCDSKVNSVIVASGNNFPDALAGSGLSKKLNAPILLVDNDVKNSLDSIDYIKNHLNKSGKIYILGGQASVSEKYVNYIKTLGYKNIIRLGGKNRFDTNRIIVNSMNVEKGTPVVITNAYGFADALSVSSAAASKGYPILMSDSKNLSNEIKNKIKDIQPSKVYLIGGQGSLNNSIKSQIKSIVSNLNDSNIVRIGGNSRYDTSLEICKYFNLSSKTAIIANGQNFPDALSGSALASKENAPIILTDGKDITNQKKYLNSTNYKNLIILGGAGAVNYSLEDILKGTINELDIIKSKSLYNFNMKDNTGKNYAVYIYSDDNETKIADFNANSDWNFVWAGASEGDNLTRGHFKIAVSKQGETEPEIYSMYDNTILTLNLNRKLIKVHNNKQLNQPDFLLAAVPTCSNVSEMKAYYIKDGKLKVANFKHENEISNIIYDFNSISPFFKQKEGNIFETSIYDNGETFRFYLKSWKFDLNSGNFIFLGERSMSVDEYSNYR
jgi:putative cell wall-binding protein